MELRWPLVGVALAVLVAVLLMWWLRRERSAADGVLVAHAQRLRDLPRYRALIRRRSWTSAWHGFAALVLIAGTIVLAARVQHVERTDVQKRSRDIMICLDSSYSMRKANVRVLDQVTALIDDLRGDRIGLTIFSGASVTVFPLTDDQQYATEQLTKAVQAIEDDDYSFVAGTEIGERASLMSDGLVSCVRRFDRFGEERSRVVLLASDNDPLGPPVFTLAQAGRYAARRDISVHGIAAPSLLRNEDKLAEFRDSVLSTGGTFSVIGDDAAGAETVSRIERLEQIKEPPKPAPLLLEDPRWGTILTGFGFLLLALGWLFEAVGVRRRRRP